MSARGGGKSPARAANSCEARASTRCPLSAITPRSAIRDPQALRITTKVNGEIMQDANTAQMIFPVRTLVAELSRGMTLLKGTIILTGTPAGVGAARTPPRFLRDGDVVEITIDQLGTLRNPVRLERAAASSAPPKLQKQQAR